VVQALLSLHVLLLLASWQMPLTQESVVQTLLSLQSLLLQHS
jgi:hypothetical protein